MPVEFALRPRIRLREDSPRPRRTRVRIPRFALPVAAYWLVMGGITYAFVHRHDAPSGPPATDESALATPPTPREDRPWWQRVPAAPAAESATPSPAAEPALTPAAPSLPAPVPALAAEAEPTPERAAETEPREPAAFAAPRVRATDPIASIPRVEQPSVTARPADDALALLPLLSAPELDVAPSPAPTPAPVPAPPRTDPHDSGLPSCEAAIESAHQDVDFSQGNGTADLPTSVIAAVLENGAWLASCNVPDHTSLDVCVAIRAGHVIGASVLARPTNPEVSGCVRRRAASLQFPYSAHVDIARTRF